MLVAWMMTGPAVGDEQPKADPPDGKNKPDAAEKVTPLGSLTGVLRSVGNSQGTMSLRVSWNYLEPNPEAEKALLQEQQEILRKQRQIMSTRNPAQRYREMTQLVQHVRRLARTEQNLFRVKEAHKDIDLEPAQDMKVRTMYLPQTNDDKGYLKKYTSQEIRELRGKGNLPGYAAAADILAANQIVTVYVVMKKETGKEADKEAKETPAESKPVVSLILVRTEAPAGK